LEIAAAVDSIRVIKVELNRGTCPYGLHIGGTTRQYDTSQALRELKSSPGGLDPFQLNFARKFTVSSHRGKPQEITIFTDRGKFSYDWAFNLKVR
jgi:hypothetical protein